MLNKTEVKYNFINYLIYLYPLAFVLGNLAINILTILICFFGTIILKTKILKINFEEILLLFFFIILFLSSAYNFYNSNFFLKSIFFFRFFLLYLIISFLIKNNLLKLNLFLIVSAVCTLVVCLDIIYQNYFNYNLLGNIKKVTEYHASGVFGKELVAGGYIVRFCFFTFAMLVLFSNSKFQKYNLLFLNIIFFFSILFSGNKMPIVIYFFGIFLAFLFLKKYRILFLYNFFICLLITFILYNFHEKTNLQIGRIYSGAKQILLSSISEDFNIKEDSQDRSTMTRGSSNHYSIFLASIEIFKQNKLFGGGIKSFETKCSEQKIYLKSNRNCSNHSHNYYLSILNNTGIMGFLLFTFYLFVIFIGLLKNLKFSNDNQKKSLIIYLIIIVFIELFPLKSTGNFFSTGNATYIFLILSFLNYGNSQNKKLN